MGDDYLQVNRTNWDDRARLHPQSPGYDLDRFRRDPSALSDVVQFDVPRLGDIAGLEVVHLQCHIGTDTLSLSRLGAHVTGLDFSSVAIESAKALAAETGARIDYVCRDVHDAVEALGSECFDVVYTGIGAIGWLPSIQRWATTWKPTPRCPASTGSRKGANGFHSATPCRPPKTQSKGTEHDRPLLPRVTRDGHCP